MFILKQIKKILKLWDELNIRYEIITLDKAVQIVHEYSKPRLVIGMRGHAQLIPFGCNTPILSIISHDKMQYFLDDIHHPEWGVDVKDEKFGTKLYNKAVDYYSNYQDNIDEILKEQDYLLKVTTKNMDFIKNILK